MISTLRKPKWEVTALISLLLTALLAGLAFSPRSADAHPCPPDVEHSDFHGVNCGEPGHDSPHREVTRVDAGQVLREDLVLKAYIPNEPGRHYLNAGDVIRVSMHGFSFSGADFSETNADNAPFDRIILADSADAAAANPTNVAVDGDTLILTLPDLHSTHAHQPDEHLIIFIKKETAIVTPRIPRGFGDDSEGYLVAVTFVDSPGSVEAKEILAADENIVVVRNPVSSAIPGDAVRVELAAIAEGGIHESEDIAVDFSGPTSDSSFTVPDSIGESTIQIRFDSKTYTPSEVLVRGSQVILTVPSEMGPGLIQAEYSVIFKQSAGIKNPISAGIRTIVVSSFAEGDLDDEIVAVIRRTTQANPLFGIRGSQFTLTGKGYAKGTVTVFRGEDREIDPGEILASVKTEKGAFEVTLKAEGKPGDSHYRVNTVDSNGAVDSVEFEIRSSLSFQPITAGVGSRLKVQISDWRDEHEGLAALRIAGRTAHIAGVREYPDCVEFFGLLRPDDIGVVTLDIVVPEGVPPGEQTVSVYGPNQLEVHGKERCSTGTANSGGALATSAELQDDTIAIVTGTIEILDQSLRISPASASRGQEITITGSGFTRQGGGPDGILRVTIGGMDVAEAPSGFDVSSRGYIAMTVTVPQSLPDGPSEVRVDGEPEHRGNEHFDNPEGCHNGGAIGKQPA